MNLFLSNRIIAAVLILLMVAAYIAPAAAAGPDRELVKNYVITYIVSSNLEFEYDEIIGTDAVHDKQLGPKNSEELLIICGAEDPINQSGISASR